MEGLNRVTLIEHKLHPRHLLSSPCHWSILPSESVRGAQLYFFFANGQSATEQPWNNSNLEAGRQLLHVNRRCGPCRR